MRISLWSRIATLLALTIVVSLSSGYYVYDNLMPEPTVEYTVVEITKEVIKTRYVSYPVQVEVVKEIQVYRELTDWDSVEELEAFLEQDNTDRHLFLKAGSDGVVKFNNQCEDFALQLRDRAMDQGKHLSIVPLHREEYYKWYNVRLEANHYHAICGARIGNEFWYVEPSTDRVWLALYLDKPEIGDIGFSYGGGFEPPLIEEPNLGQSLEHMSEQGKTHSNAHKD